MGYSTILAIDLGKFKSVLCVMDVATRTHRFVRLESTPTLIRQTIGEHLSSDPARTLVVFETCDTCGWVHDSIVDLGVAITIVNANDERWRWQRVKRKTDQDDALKLARLALLDQLPRVHLPDANQRQRRRLMIHRRSMVCRRTRFELKDVVRHVGDLD